MLGSAILVIILARCEGISFRLLQTNHSHFSSQRLSFLRQRQFGCKTTGHGSALHFIKTAVFIRGIPCLFERFFLLFIPLFVELFM